MRSPNYARRSLFFAFDNLREKLIYKACVCVWLVEDCHVPVSDNLRAST